MKRFTRTAALAALVAAGVPGAAGAHVTLQPNEVPAGEFKRLDVRVPNERDDASTRKVVVRFPPGFIFVSHEPVAGWEAEVRMARLDKPVEAFGETRTEQVDTVTFTATGRGVGPGQFQDFGLSVAVPDKPGTTLTFKAVQTYSGGEVVRWIGAPDAEQPAPRVKLTAAAAEGAAAHGAGSAAQATQAAAAGGGGDGSDGGDALSVIALMASALGLLAGVAGLMMARRSRAAATA